MDESEKDAQREVSGKTPCYVNYFLWGAKHHPGNVIYLALLVSIFGYALNNINCLKEILAVCVAIILLAILYIFTSISVGKANEKLVMEDTG